MAAGITKYVAFGLTMLFGLLGGLFVIGETFADPGGWPAVWLVACWLVPMAALIALAVLRPERAGTVLTWATGAVAVFVLLYSALAPRTAPADAVAVLALTVALGFLGVRHPGPSGVLMMASGAALVLGMLLGALVHGHAVALGGSAGAVALPVLAIGALFVLAGALGRTPARRSGGTGSGGVGDARRGGPAGLQPGDRHPER